MNKFKKLFWWYLVSFWTILVFGGVITNSLTNNEFEDILGPLLAVYIGILAIYVGDKELERWHNSHISSHPGEIFVLVWTLILVGLAVCEFIMRGNCHIPSELVSAYIAVVSILALTQRSKSLYEIKRRRRN